MSDFHDILIIVLKLLDEKVISSPGPSRKWEKPFSFCTLIVTPIKCRTKASIYEYWYSICFHLTLSWRQPLSYRNQSNQWTGFYMITASVMKELSSPTFISRSASWILREISISNTLFCGSRSDIRWRYHNVLN